jgi:CheY-like chemotaxis protein
MRIVSLEDDEPFWDLLQHALNDAFPGADLLWIRTESEFRQKIEEFAASPPDIILLDVMVKWADAAEDMPEAPAEVSEQGYFRAGLRCRKLLMENPATLSVPVIFLTVLERSDIESVEQKFPANTAFVAKSGNFTAELVGKINQLNDRSHVHSTKKPVV